MFRLRITGDIGFEYWANVPGFEEYYQASTYGRIRGVDRVCEKKYDYGTVDYKIKGKILREGVRGTKSTYKSVFLYKDGSYKNYMVHRIVAETFIPNFHNCPCINHKDENRFNNRVENLEWCTWKYNVNYSAYKFSKPIIQYDKDGNFIKEWIGSSDIERIKGYNRYSISRCCNGKPSYKTAYGYIWKFKD